jgi:uncharacterized protein (DUF849 family)
MQVADIRRMKACLNGRRAPGSHPALPVTPDQLGRAAAEAVEAGAEAIHVHPRGSDGRESLDAADMGAAVFAIRAACPGVPVGVTTGLWAAADARVRHAQIAAWSRLDSAALPDFASLNLHEHGSREVAAMLAAAGVGVEAGVWSVVDVGLIAAFEPPGGWLRIMVEISGVPADQAADQAGQILERLRAAGATAPILVHGEDESCWPLIAEAGRLGLPARIGLEDVIAGPDGQPVSGNAELVRLAIEVWTEATGT